MALWKRAVLSLVLVLAAAVAIAPSGGSPRTIPAGVRIAGINVSGLDAGQARQQTRPASARGFASARRTVAAPSPASRTLSVRATFVSAYARAFRQLSGSPDSLVFMRLPLTNSH
jgi:hypothetical protein